MLSLQPSTLSVCQLSEVKAILQHRPYGVFGEGICAAISRSAIACIIQCLGNLAIGLPSSRKFEGQHQAGMILGMGNWNAISSLCCAKRQDPVIESLGLAFSLAFLRLGAEIVTVELRQPHHHGQLELAIWTRIVGLLAYRHESDMSLSQPVEGIERYIAVASKAVQLMNHNDIKPTCLRVNHHLVKAGSLAHVIGAGALSFIPVPGHDLVALLPAVGVNGAVLGIEAEAVNLFFRTDSDISRNSSH